MVETKWKLSVNKKAETWLYNCRSSKLTYCLLINATLTPQYSLILLLTTQVTQSIMVFKKMYMNTGLTL
jgi:hypothetical protein